MNLMTLSRNLWRHVLAIVMGLLSLLVIFFPALYWPAHWLAVHGALIVTVVLAALLEWKDGALRAELGAIPGVVRKSGLKRFPWLQPVPLAGWVLFCVAASHMQLTLP
jgi:hypothetical protein